MSPEGVVVEGELVLVVVAVVVAALAVVDVVGESSVGDVGAPPPHADETNIKESAAAKPGRRLPRAPIHISTFRFNPIIHLTHPAA
jgi:hypothetical protein